MIVDELLRSDEPSIRWKVRFHLFGEDSKKLREEVRRSPRVKALLARTTPHVYAKWQGAHWVLATLAELGYPPGDDRLLPLRDRVYDGWLDERYFREFEAARKAEAYRQDGVPVMRGRHRRCASQQGNALHFLEKLGIADARSERLVERLLR